MARELSELARMLYEAKQAEKQAKDARIAVEEEIATLVVIDGDKGSKTVDAGSGLKITVERKLNYKADVEAIRKLELPNPPLKAVPWSWSFDAAAYEKLRTDPATAAALASCVTVTPAKVAVSLKLA